MRPASSAAIRAPVGEETARRRGEGLRGARRGWRFLGLRRHPRFRGHGLPRSMLKMSGDSGSEAVISEYGPAIGLRGFKVLMVGDLPDRKAALRCLRTHRRLLVLFTISYLSGETGYARCYHQAPRIIVRHFSLPMSLPPNRSEARCWHSTSASSSGKHDLVGQSGGSGKNCRCTKIPALCR